MSHATSAYRRSPFIDPRRHAWSRGDETRCMRMWHPALVRRVAAKCSQKNFVSALGHSELHGNRSNCVSIMHSRRFCSAGRIAFRAVHGQDRMHMSGAFKHSRKSRYCAQCRLSILAALALCSICRDGLRSPAFWHRECARWPWPRSFDCRAPHQRLRHFWFLGQDVCWIFRQAWLSSNSPSRRNRCDASTRSCIARWRSVLLDAAACRW